MAKISARGAHAVAQVKGTKPDDHTADGLCHVTVTARSDGAILRQVARKHGNPAERYGTWWSRSNNAIIARATPDQLADVGGRLLPALRALVKRWGYEPQ